MQCVLYPVRSISLILTLLRSFLALSGTYFNTFLLSNLIKVWPLFPTRWQSLMSSAVIPTPALVIALHRTFSRSLSLTEERMTVISRHSRLEYWVFAQNCLSKAINFSLREQKGTRLTKSGRRVQVKFLENSLESQILTYNQVHNILRIFED